MVDLNKGCLLVKDYEDLALRALLDLDSERNCSDTNACEKKSAHNIGSYFEEKFEEYNLQETPERCGLPQSKKGDSKKVLYSDGNKSLLPKNYQPDSSSFTDPVFGLRLAHPLISSLLLTERMSSRTAITFTQLSRHATERDMPKEWVIGGVILTSETKTNSKTNKPFTIWKISDLRGDLKTLSLLLFQSAHDELWKTRSGTCVAVLNPRFIQNKSSVDVASLSINSAKNVLLLGASKDMGVCKAKKRNAERCKNFVNINECDFCTYHVEREYKKLTRPVTMKQLKRHDKSIRSSDIFNASPSFSTNKLFQRDQFLMNNLQTSTTSMSISSSVKSLAADLSLQGFRTGVASNCETEINQRVKDLERLKCLRSKFNNSTSSATKTCVKLNTAMKVEAIEKVKNCPIEKVDPNSTRGSKEGKRRAVDKLNMLHSPKRHKSETIPNIDKIVETVSAHRYLIDIRQKEEEDKYFHELEKKEAMEEKMLNTFQIPCKAVICRICRYAAFSAADHCKDERHTIKIIDAVKRFFQCKDCGYRTTTLFKFPKLSCANCASSKWERCGMVRDRTHRNSLKKLSVRGDEEKYLGSAYKTNIDLLMPKE